MASVAPQLTSSPGISAAEQLTAVKNILRSIGEDLLQNQDRRTFPSFKGFSISMTRDPALGTIQLLLQKTSTDSVTHTKNTDTIQVNVRESDVITYINHAIIAHPGQWTPGLLPILTTIQEIAGHLLEIKQAETAKSKTTIQTSQNSTHSATEDLLLGSGIYDGTTVGIPPNANDRATDQAINAAVA